MSRKVADCRDFPDSNCTLMISGEEHEVIRAAADHAVSVHGYERTATLEEEIRGSLKDEVPLAQAPIAAAAREQPRH